MKYKIFVGVIFYNCPKLEKDVVETLVLIACDWAEAENKTRAYALDYAKKTNLIYQDFRIFVQAQHLTHISNCVHFVKTGTIVEGCYLDGDPKVTSTKVLNRGRRRVKLQTGGKTYLI